MSTKIRKLVVVGLFALTAALSSPSVSFAATLTPAPTDTTQSKNEVSIETLEFMIKR